MGQSNSPNNREERLQEIVSIYGTNYNDFRWHEGVQNKSTYHTTGMLIRLLDGDITNTYVITTRTKIIGCQTIVMFFNCLSDTKQIMSLRLFVLFQMIEFDLVILGAGDKQCIDYSLSQIISGSCFPTKFPMGNHLNEYIVTHTQLNLDCFLVQTRLDSKIEKTRINPDIVTSKDEILNLDYQFHIRPVSYVDTIVDYTTYLPPICKYQFVLDDDHNDQSENSNNSNNINNSNSGIIGSIVCDCNGNLIGIAHKINDSNFYVIPCSYVIQMINYFLTFRSDQFRFEGPLTLPLDLSFVNDRVQINNSIKINTVDGPKLFKKNDKIIELNDKNLGSNLTIWSDKFEKEIPIDVYFRMECEYGVPMKISINRHKKKIVIAAYGIFSNQWLFPLTDQPYFFPKNSIPYVDVHGIIIVSFTHDLIDLLISNGKIPSNFLIDDFFANGITRCIRYLLVIDCFNPSLKDMYSLPVLKSKNKNLEPFVVKKINRKKISTLKEIEDIKLTDESFSSIELETSVQNQIKIVFSC
jgi:hypothetical protein